MKNKIRENFHRSHPYLGFAINEKLEVPLKEGIYLSDYFLSKFDSFDLWQILENWSDENLKSKFLKELDKTVKVSLDEIQENLSKKIKDRNEIIIEIFQLYKNNYFSGTITLVLSQVDGLMKEITGGKEGFYSSTHEDTKKSKPNRLKHLDHEIYINYFSEFHLLDVRNRNDYMLFKKDIDDLKAFNRHSILHGESAQFGTHLNALKAILLLVFIGDLYDNTINKLN